MNNPAKEKKLCGGCYNEEYHYGLGGSKICWSYHSAKIIKRIPIPIDRPPPYNKEDTVWMFDCYNKKRMVYVKPDILNSEGYWK